MCSVPRQVALHLVDGVRRSGPLLPNTSIVRFALSAHCLQGSVSEGEADKGTRTLGHSWTWRLIVGYCTPGPGGTSHAGSNLFVCRI